MFEFQTRGYKVSVNFSCEIPPPPLFKKIRHCRKRKLVFPLGVLTDKTVNYSETCIKRTPFIKRTVAEVAKFISLIYFK